MIKVTQAGVNEQWLRGFQPPTSMAIPRRSTMLPAFLFDNVHCTVRKSALKLLADLCGLASEVSRKVVQSRNIHQRKVCTHELRILQNQMQAIRVEIARHRKEHGC